jgi:hypothetical protein
LRGEQCKLHGFPVQRRRVPGSNFSTGRRLGLPVKSHPGKTGRTELASNPASRS